MGIHVSYCGFREEPAREYKRNECQALSAKSLFSVACQIDQTPISISVSNKHKPHTQTHSED